MVTEVECKRSKLYGRRWISKHKFKLKPAYLAFVGFRFDRRIVEWSLPPTVPFWSVFLPVVRSLTTDNMAFLWCLVGVDIFAISVKDTKTHFYSLAYTRIKLKKLKHLLKEEENPVWSKIKALFLSQVKTMSAWSLQLVNAPFQMA